MSEALIHTPGPLTYEREFSGENWLVAEVVIYDADGQRQEFCITTDHVSTSEDVMGDPEADVRLWTAAPDLLTACEVLLKEQEQDGTCSSRDCPNCSAQAIGRAAIAKAKGQGA